MYRYLWKTWVKVCGKPQPPVDILWKIQNLLPCLSLWLFQHLNYPFPIPLTNPV